MKVAVITPYYKESIEFLENCHQSVLNQTYPVSHIMVADGFPNNEIDNWAVDHIILPHAHGDNGSTPRLIGSYHAIGLGYDAIAYLDADNWYMNNHIESLIELHNNTGANFLSSSRFLCRLDGSVMGDCKQTDPDKFIDTSCMMFVKSSFFILGNWVLMPKYMQPLCDRVMLYWIKKSGIVHAHINLQSVFFRCSKEGVYLDLGEEIPEGVLKKPDYEYMFKRWVEEGNTPL
jgi:glycosyltransferase involved in cell wall biosynthesis